MTKPISRLLFSPRLCPNTRLFPQTRVHKSQQSNIGEAELSWVPAVGGIPHSPKLQKPASFSTIKLNFKCFTSFNSALISGQEEGPIFSNRNAKLSCTIYIKLTCPIDVIPLCRITENRALANLRKTGLEAISRAVDTSSTFQALKLLASCSDSGSCFYEDHYLS